MAFIRVDRHRSVPTPREGAERLLKEFVQEFPIGVDALNEICPHWQRATYITLKMSSQRIYPEILTDKQINALRECVKLLRNGLVNEEQTIENRQKLIECGLPPMISGNDSIVQN